MDNQFYVNIFSLKGVGMFRYLLSFVKLAI